MLILTRCPNEMIRISDNITFTVLSVKGKQVRIGINAPADISVHREEIYQRIQAQQNDSRTAQEDVGWDKHRAGVKS